MFKKYFITEAEEVSKTPLAKKQTKISSDFELELRKLYKIKMVIYTAFGIQIDFLKSIEKDEILNIIDPKFNVKFKGKSIFIEF